jgi:lipopolysaccharide export system permease protein
VLDNPMALFTADQVADGISGVRVYAAEKEGNELRGFQMVQYEAKRATVFVTADRVFVERTADGQTLELHMSNARIQVSSDEGTPEAEPDPTAKAWVVFADTVQEVSLEKNLEKATKRSPSARGSRELLAMARDPGYDEGERCSFRVEFHKRLSFSMACFTFALIGVPLGVTAQRRETSVGFALSLIIAVVYFLFIIIADWFKESPEAHPQLLVWLPNIVFIAIGLWRFTKLARA